jgi:hypothetical protein
MPLNNLRGIFYLLYLPKKNIEHLTEIYKLADFSN